MNTRSLIGSSVGLAVAMLLLVLTASSCETKPAEAACTQSGPQCLQGVSFKDTYDEVYPPEVLAGKVVVVNFWATWCKPCKKEIPAFNKVYEEYKDQGVMMFGILQEDVDQHTLLNFASDHEMTYPIVYLDQTLARHFGVPNNIPTTYIYDKHGKRRVERTGSLEAHELRRHLDELLRQP